MRSPIGVLFSLSLVGLGACAGSERIDPELATDAGEALPDASWPTDGGSGVGQPDAGLDGGADAGVEVPASPVGGGSRGGWR